MSKKRSNRVLPAVLILACIIAAVLVIRLQCGKELSTGSASGGSSAEMDTSEVNTTTAKETLAVEKTDTVAEKPEKPIVKVQKKQITERELNRQVDTILDKVSRSGMDSLSRKERKILELKSRGRKDGY